MSSLWYFNAVWVGSKKVLRKIKALLHDYLWLAFENTAREWVCWDDYVMLKEVGVLSLTSQEDAMRALMSKWTVQALLPSQVEFANLVEVPH